MSEEDDQLADQLEAERLYATGELCAHGYADSDCPDTGCPFTHQSPALAAATALTPEQIAYALNKIQVSDREERIAASIADALRTVADDIERWHGQERIKMTVVLTQHAPEAVIPKAEDYKFDDFDLEDFGVEVEQLARDRANELLNTGE